MIQRNRGILLYIRYKSICKFMIETTDNFKNKIRIWANKNKNKKCNITILPFLDIKIVCQHGWTVGLWMTKAKQGLKLSTKINKVLILLFRSLFSAQVRNYQHVRGINFRYFTKPVTNILGLFSKMKRWNALFIFF